MIGETQFTFDRLVRNGITNIDQDDLKRVALALWYEGFTPKVMHFEETEIRYAAYLIDRLRRYVIASSRQAELTTIVNHIKSRLIIVIDTTQVKQRRRNTAMWGIVINREGSIYLNNKMRALLPYQTRHYRHKTNELFVSALEELRRAETEAKN